MINRLQEKFEKEIKVTLAKEFEIKNKMQFQLLPRLLLTWELETPPKTNSKWTTLKEIWQQLQDRLRQSEMPKFLLQVLILGPECR